jgi:hypothetical protein
MTTEASYSLQRKLELKSGGVLRCVSYSHFMVCFDARP